MGHYIARRLIQSFFVVFAVVILVFVLARLTGDPAQLYIDACVGKHVPGLGYSAEVGIRDFTFKLNEALVKAGKI